MLVRANKLLLCLVCLGILSGCGGSGSESTPEVTPQSDTQAPVITLHGEDTVALEVGTAYQELNAVATDNVDASVSILISGSVDVQKVGEYVLTYSATDSAGNSASLIRTITVTPRVVSVVDSIAPVISLVGPSMLSLDVGSEYTEQGATVTDNVDMGLSVEITGNVDISAVGQYSLAYSVTDSAGNNSTVNRIISVIDNLAPEITINGQEHVTLDYQAVYAEQNASAIDNVDGVVSVAVSGEVDTSMLKEYPVTYTATDAAGNVAELKRIVTVADLTKPVINLNGDTNVDIVRFTAFEDLGAVASDNYDSQLDVTVSGDSVDITTAGRYTITYSTIDSSGNEANVVERVVNVLEQAPLIVTFDTTNDNTVTLEFIEDNSALEIDWGNGEGYIDMATPISHTFDSVGMYQVKIRGIANALRFCANNSTQLKSVNDWGQVVWLSMAETFQGCNNFDNTIVSVGKPDLTTATHFVSMHATFLASNFDQVIGNWDVSNVNDMELLFTNSRFNQDISAWDVSNVTNMGQMFNSADFDQDISQWNVSSVTDMNSMFAFADFNKDISQWNVSNVTNMSAMFFSSPYNHPLADWDLSSVVTTEAMFTNSQFNLGIDQWNMSNVINMRDMFSGSQFDQDISQWEVGKVVTMEGMFRESQFNQELNDWDVSSVDTMDGMFEKSKFDHSLNDWDVSNVTTMEVMFNESEFNSAIGDWDVSNVMKMTNLFSKTDFNQDISQWNVANVENMASMFSNTPFNQDISQWQVGKVTDMSALFFAAPFNFDISGWDVSNVTDMSFMFYRSPLTFDIGNWNVAKVTDMSFMFLQAAQSHDLSKWNISQVTTMQNMFVGANLSIAHYSAMLLAWSQLPVQDGVIFSSGGTQHSNAAGVQAARFTLINDKDWNISDGGSELP